MDHKFLETMEERQMLATMLSIATIAAQASTAMEIQEKKLDLLYQRSKWSLAEEIAHKQLTGTTDAIKEAIASAENKLKEMKEKVQEMEKSSVFKEDIRVMKDFAESMEPALITIKSYNNRLEDAMKEVKDNIIKKMGN